MKKRLAKKICKKALGCNKYLKIMVDSIDAAFDTKRKKPHIKIKQQYWEPRWALHFANLGGIRSRDDHRIKKAIILLERWNAHKIKNDAKKLLGTNPFKVRDLHRSVKQLERYNICN